MIATRRACALVKAASVATTTSVVFSPGWPLVLKASACGGTDAGRPRPPNSSSRSYGAAQKCGPPPITAEPAALTTASAPTVVPSRVCAEAEPMPPFKSAVVAPRPAPALPSAKSAAAPAVAA